MTTDGIAILAFITFAVSTSASPGPNNFMLTVSGANYGFRRCIPHILGISFGFLALLLLSSAGLGVMFEMFPALHDVLRYVGGGYLLYLAWRVLGANQKIAGHGDTKPFTFTEAAVFQFVNPKAWIMAASAVSTFVPNNDRFVLWAVLIAVLFTLVNIPANAIWAGFGTVLGKLLSNGRYLRGFNVVMAGMLALSVFTLFV